MFQPDGPSLAELTRQALSSTRRGYDLIAEKFDHTPFRTPDPILDVVADYLRRTGVGRAGLDVCCGTGAATAMLKGVCSEEVVGLDFSEGMLGVAAGNTAAAAGDATVELVQCDALAMPFEDRFDVAVCFGAFGHFVRPEQPTLLAGIHRALKPGGRFVFCTSDRPGPLHPTANIYRAFNLVMRARNRLLQPKFIMYYLNFLLPEAVPLLKDAGFEVQQVDPGLKGPLRRLVIVDARKPAA